MGKVSHKALIVTGFDKHHVDKARTMAMSLNLQPTPCQPYRVNSGASFALLPSGSKVGWREDSQHAETITRFIEWMTSWNPWKVDLTEERGNSLEWVLVEFGHPDESPNRVINTTLRTSC